MLIFINNKDGVPIYDQIYSQIKEQIINGTLEEDAPLPSIRSLAKDLQISVITTKRAYDELEKSELIYTAPGRGSFVSAKNTELLREENLKKMASRLLLVREGINFAYLMTDHAKCEEAFAAATAIAAAAGIPAAVKAIQMGILASWAYAESIAEMRTLFEGGMAASVKTSENWTVSLAEAALVPFQTSVKSKEVQKGLDYEDYLQAFLAIESLKKIGERLANLLEKNFRLYAGYDQIKMDHMITAMETSHRYQARQVFLTFVTIARLSKKGYQYETLYRFSYTPEKDSE